ncbi:MAG: excinuclease ABC subunit UvrA [Bacteroides sp.]|nr:excinuclease ABC subunit UvrA [Bacteroides sp.]MCM1412927.1 excinuclease ABC subunit UvrA [Bacteroides sp.]MCM1471596.1 excinuclease ABC subunit UvrA [Bacteroides sp.]
MNKRNDNISIRGARVNNLQNVDVDIPRNKLTVVTGLSGSGKSSLAFDTLYAEGQRRYVESLSAYARQFLGRMAKPECDKIIGIPPAIAIEQKVNTRNPRSTVGTSTEIYDYMRLLFGRIGRTFSPVSGEEVKKHSAEDVVNTALLYPDGTRIAVVAPVVVPDGREPKAQLDVMLKGGYTRLAGRDGRFVNIADLIADDKEPIDIAGYDLLIDRLTVVREGDDLSRLTEAAETAFFEGGHKASLLVWPEGGAMKRHDFSNSFDADGMTFIEPSEMMFNFNNPYGACPRCEGFGRTVGIDERLVVPDQSLSVFDDAVVCWRGEKMSEWKQACIRAASSADFPIHRPYNELTREQKDFLWHGNAAFSGIDGFFKMVEENLYKIQYRVMLARYRGKTECPDCHGGRLRREAQYVKVGGRTIMELVKMPVTDLLTFFRNLHLDDTNLAIAGRILVEICSRLEFLVDVGLGYLTLDRLSSTLSGGESQRINLATSLGSSLIGSLYILDEPSIGLHSRDTMRLISVLRKLQGIGNTVVVVEHDEDIMRHADYLIDVGPEAGSGGGHIVYQGPADEIGKASADSYTARYLSGDMKIAVPKHRRRWRDYIEVEGAREHNLKNISVRFPLEALTVVTGVSGSGKSTLVRDILYRALLRHLGQPTDAPGLHTRLRGDLGRISAVEFVDQNPIGRSTRSNPATYLKAYDEIRRLFADQQGAKQMGFGPGYFSFNTEGGRCEECKGEGTITIEMQFMADIVIPCEECHGKRFKHDVLDIRYRGKNINDVLDMTIDDAIAFFSETDGATERRIVKRLLPLQQVGLGYVKLGQSSSTLSGGENQRVKLAYYLAMDKPQPTMFIFDEPTTGLHFHDISKLMESFDRLITLGHTVVIIEHNLDVVKCADHVIDIGPEGGDKGGEVVATGTPEQIVGEPRSYTGKFLREKI